jgi:MFS family permease
VVPDNPVGGEPGQPWRRKRVEALSLPAALIILGLAYWCVDTTSPALPVIRDDLAISATGAGLIISLFFGGRLVANLPAAITVDRRGPRVTAAFGAVLLGLGSALAAIAPDEIIILPARALQGAGVAFLATAGLLSVLRMMPASGAAMTAFNVSAGIGGSFGLLAGGFLTGLYGWRSIFWSCVLLSIVMFAAAVSGVGKSRVATTRRGASSPAPEEHVALPLREPALIGAMLANLLVFANYSIWVVGLPLYAASRFGAGPQDIGNLLLVVNIVHIAGAFLAGGVIRRLGAVRSLGAGLFIVTIGMMTMILSPNPWLIGVPASLYALGSVAGNSSAGELLLRLGGGGGRAVGLVRITSDTGMVLGPVAAGMLVDEFGVRAPFLALSALSLLGAAMALRTTRARRGAVSGV